MTAIDNPTFLWRPTGPAGSDVGCAWPQPIVKISYANKEFWLARRLRQARSSYWQEEGKHHAIFAADLRTGTALLQLVTGGPEVGDGGVSQLRLQVQVSDPCA